MIILFRLPYEKKFAYHYIEDNCFDRGSWLYDRIFENDLPVDIAFIGTSHTMNAVNDSLLSNIIPKDKKMQIANLGFCWQGYNAEYVILKDLLQSKHPQKVIIEIREWTENDNHLIFPYLADAEDIAGQPYLSKASCISNLYTAALARWEYFRFGYNKINVNDSLKTSFGFIPNGDTLSLSGAENQILFQEKRFGIGGTHLNNDVKEFDKFYLNKMIELCNAHHAAIYFLYLPAYGDIRSQPIDKSFFENYPILIPDQKIFNTRTYWGNTNHLNDDGATKLTEWLAGSILFEEYNQLITGNN